ncbi:hypothetical protein [Polyangium spumosum]|uniref:Uncharacterized protein n=1 Tax=Polyangium spumosum TaxID=889282 RepID=A0A6N7PYQ4_9BACT|nr:hypothetical protein [Polyangium spumosum]MRG93861.1 hypothetical protein [Polyangium spumosum]
MLHRKTVVMASVLAGFVLACGPEASNTTGAGGAGGTGGAGGAGGSGGSGTTPDPAGPKDPGAALKAAIFVGSCVPDDGIQRVLNRFHTERGTPDELALTNYTQCFAEKANGCQAVEECLGVKIDLSGPCMPTCTGDVLKVCDDQLAFTVDCSKVGTTCSEAEGNCVGAAMPGPTCDPGSFQASCQDGAPRVCNGSEVSGPVCADYGLTCKDAPFGGVACLGTGATCQTDLVGPLEINYDKGLACDGTALRACVNGGEHAIECGTLVTGFTCQTMGVANFCGLANECDPTPGNDTTCEGDSVVICNAGKIEKIDCKSLGFTSCNATFGTCGPSVYDQAPMP